MFGNFHRSLDDKNRLVIPSRFRKDLGKVFFVSYGADKVLEIRSEESFNKWKDKLLNAGSINKTLRAYKRFFFGNTFEVESDKLGRFTLQQSSIDFAAIKNEVVILGLGDKIEIWSKQNYEKFSSNFDDNNSIDNLEDKLQDEGVIL